MTKNAISARSLAIVAGTALVALLCCPPSVATAQQSPIAQSGETLGTTDLLRGKEAGRFTVRFNGNDVAFDPVLLERGSLEVAATKDGELLPDFVRLLARAGAETQYDADARVLTVARPGFEIDFRLGQRGMVVNGELRPSGTPPRQIEGYLMVPLALIMSTIGAYVRWLPDQSVLDISYRG